LYADYEGAIVRKGQPLLELYSPELVSAQEEYLLAIQNSMRMKGTAGERDADRLLEAARRRLAYWDLSDDQILRLESSAAPQRTMTFYAPASGEVMNKNVIEGQQIDAGQSVMDIVDISRIWLIADIYEQDLAWVEEGTPARIELPYQPGRTWTGKVDHIYLMMNLESRSARARIDLPAGPDSPLRPGMYATVYLEAEQEDPTPVVPDEALIRTGEKTFVVEALGEGRFAPRQVVAGIQTGGKVQLLEGIEAGRSVVTSAQFLIDSEAKLQSAVGAMLGAHDHSSH
jgi:RND family efflux transporter MFP subunit